MTLSAGHLYGPTDGMGSLPYRSETEMARRRQRGVEAPAVVDDPQREIQRADIRLDINVPGTRVAGHVGQRLACDSRSLLEHRHVNDDGRCLSGSECYGPSGGTVRVRAALRRDPSRWFSASATRRNVGAALHGCARHRHWQELLMEVCAAADLLPSLWHRTFGVHGFASDCLKRWSG